jgi:hypothetical protein
VFNSIQELAIVKLDVRRDIAGGIDHAFVTPPATGEIRSTHVRPEIFNNHKRRSVLLLIFEQLLLFTG